jgi:hypothetical protein
MYVRVQGTAVSLNLLKLVFWMVTARIDRPESAVLLNSPRLVHELLFVQKFNLYLELLRSRSSTKRLYI